MSILELYQRRIDCRYIPNLMRAANMTEQQAESQIRLLFPIVRGVEP